MRLCFLISLGMFLALEIQAQQFPVFKHKKDSVEYAKLDSILIPRIEKASAARDFGGVDSAFRARSKFLEGKDFFYRTRFHQDKSFTPYQALSGIANKDSITRISVLGKGRRKLPDSLYRYKNLTDLELIDFKLRRLPRKLSAKHVTVYNNFPSKPLKLSKNKTINLLTIRGDEKGMLPRRYNKLRELQSLTLARNNLNSFPNLEGCAKLRTLNLNNNNIANVDSSIAGLIALESLSLYKNNLNEIPAVLYGMKSLRVVDLYFNHIKMISPSISNWKSLEILYLANNEIYSMPNEIGELTNLRELYLHHNKLSNLPASIANLVSLNVLRINNNSMVEWPAGLTTLTSLNNFDCSFNQFETLPISALDFRNMKILSIGGNPWSKDEKPAIMAWVIALRENETVVHIDNYLSRP